jgi:hypothetical protein
MKDWGQSPPPAIHAVMDYLDSREAVLLKLMASKSPFSSRLKTPSRVRGYAHEEFTRYLYEEREDIQSVVMVVPSWDVAHSLYALPSVAGLRKLDLRMATDHFQTFLLEHMPRLQHIGLTGFNVRVAGIPPLVRCTDLHLTTAHSLELDLSLLPNLRSLCVHAEGEVSITGSFPKSLECLVLVLHRKKSLLYGTLLGQVAECTNLMHLNLSGNAMSYLPSRLLHRMPKLRSLIVRDNALVSRNSFHEDDGMMLVGLHDMHSQARELDILDLSGNVGIRTDDLSRHLQNVAPYVLDVRGCDQVPDFEVGAACFRHVHVLLTSFLPSRDRLKDTFVALETVMLQAAAPRVPVASSVVTSSFHDLEESPCSHFIEVMQPRPPEKSTIRLVTLDRRDGNHRTIRIILCDEEMRVRDAEVLCDLSRCD